MKKLKNLILSALNFSFLAAFLLTNFVSCQDSSSLNYVEPSKWSQGTVDLPVYLMASIGTGQYLTDDNLHLAYSTDGISWTAINSNAAVFTCGIGSCHIRDPFIFRMNDGSFVLLASDFTQSGKYWDLGSRSDLNYWSHSSNKIYVAYSDDLVTWTDGHLLTLTEGEGTDGGVRHCWSPKAVYNESRKCYDIYWTGDDYYGVNKVYVTSTFDFQSVKSLKDSVIYSPTDSVTWASIVSENNKFYLFARNESVDFSTGDGGDIQAAYCESWGKSFQRISKYFINRLSDQGSPVFVQYPCVYKLAGGEWVMHVNRTNSLSTFDSFVTQDISNPESWMSASDASLSFSLPSVCDASVTMISESELDVLLSAF